MCDMGLTRYRWFGFHWRSLEWWGGVCYAGGVLGYNTSSVTDIIHDCTYVNPTVLVSLWTARCCL